MYRKNSSYKISPSAEVNVNIGVLANGFYFWELLKIGLMGSIMNVLYNKPALLKVEKIE